VLPSKRGELREGNRENPKHENGNHDSSDTCGGERKIGAIIKHRTLYILSGVNRDWITSMKMLSCC